MKSNKLKAYIEYFDLDEPLPPGFLFIALSFLIGVGLPLLIFAILKELLS